MAKKDIAAEAPPAEAAPKAKILKHVVYLGPTFAEGGDVFSHGSVFNNGLPAHFTAKILLEPEFAHLIVPVEKVAQALTELRDELSFRSQLGRKFRDAAGKRTTSQEGAQ